MPDFLNSGGLIYWGQVNLDQVQRFCDENKVYFTHDDNLQLMRDFKNKNFNVDQFCESLLVKNAQRPKF